MTRLSDIAIRVEPGMAGAPAVTGGLGGGVAAILTELVTERRQRSTCAASR